MWNILIVTIVAIIIWAANPLIHFCSKSRISGVNEETRQEVQQVKNQAVEQIEYARQIQQQQQAAIDSQ